MSENKISFHRIVRFSDGGTFETNAESAGEYLLTPTFMRFFATCLVLYAAIVQRGEVISLTYPASIVFWGSVLTSSFLVLMLCVWLNVLLVDMRILKAIYTPILLVPVVVLNTISINYVLAQFGSSYLEGFNNYFEVGVRNMVIIVCFDILHGRYVAPQHPTYIQPGSSAPTAHTKDTAVVQSEPQAKPVQIISAPLEDDLPEEEEGISLSGEPREEPLAILEISKEAFNPSDILSIKSEDHYLNIQLKDQTKLVRGKLRETIKLLDEQLGLQINRSVWIAFEAIQRVEESKPGNLEVLLKNGTKFRVARARKLVFDHSFEQFKKSSEIEMN